MYQNSKNVRKSVILGQKYAEISKYSIRNPYKASSDLLHSPLWPTLIYKIKMNKGNRKGNRKGLEHSLWVFFIPHFTNMKIKVKQKFGSHFYLALKYSIISKTKNSIISLESKLHNQFWLQYPILIGIEDTKSIPIQFCFDSD